MNKTDKGQACKTPLHEFAMKVEQAENTLQNTMGSFQWDHDFALVKGFLMGYRAALARAINHYEE